MFQPSNHTVNPQSNYRGGRLQYLDYEVTADGTKKFFQVARSAEPSHTSTWYINPDKTEALWCIDLDLDLQGTLPVWCLGGKIDGLAVVALIQKNYPEFSAYLLAALQSDGGGLHLLFGFPSIQLNENTKGLQRALTVTQSKLRKLLNDAGINADRGAHGLKRFFPNFRDATRVIFWDEPLKRAFDDCTGPSVYGLINGVRKVERQDYLKSALHARANVETGLAKLIQYTLNDRLEKVSLSVSEIEKITGLGENYIRRTLKANTWPGLLCKYDEVYRTWDLKIDHLSADASHAIKLLEKKKFQYEIIMPHRVEDGERNLAITSWLLALKWTGVEEDEALRRVTLLVDVIPGSEKSRNCSLLKNKAESVYRNYQSKFASSSEILPEFLANPESYIEICLNIKHSKMRSEAISSEAEQLPCELSGNDNGYGNSDLVDDLVQISNPVPFEPYLGPKLTAVNLGATEPDNSKTQKIEKSHRKKKTLIECRYNNRVGIFVDNELVLVLGLSVHYSYRKMLKRLSESFPEYDLVRERKFTANYEHMKKVQAAESSIPASAYCGRKLLTNKALKFAAWREKNGIPLAFHTPGLTVVEIEEHF